jgi:hypothetical protein
VSLADLGLGQAWATYLYKKALLSNEIGRGSGNAGKQSTKLLANGFGYLSFPSRKRGRQGVLGQLNILLGLLGPDRSEAILGDFSG